jgi:ABC-type transporter Mla MlaB component
MPALTFAPPLAHLGHWYVSLPVFGGPVLGLALALKIQTWREARKGPDQTGKRSTVSHSRTHEQTTVSVSGPLDYPVLLELEVQLGKLAGEASEIVLDLHGLTRTDEEAVSGLCDAISMAGVHDRVRVLLPPEPAARVLSTALKNEGVRLE